MFIYIIKLKLCDIKMFEKRGKWITQEEHEMYDGGKGGGCRSLNNVTAIN